MRCLRNRGNPTARAAPANRLRSTTDLRHALPGGADGAECCRAPRPAGPLPAHSALQKRWPPTAVPPKMIVVRQLAQVAMNPSIGDPRVPHGTADHMQRSAPSGKTACVEAAAHGIMSSAFLRTDPNIPAGRRRVNEAAGWWPRVGE